MKRGLLDLDKASLLKVRIVFFYCTVVSSPTLKPRNSKYMKRRGQALLFRYDNYRGVMLLWEYDPVYRAQSMVTIPIEEHLA
jgi:hypothetical protein